MTSVRIWIGREPIGYEAKALRELAAQLDANGVRAHLLANFQINGHELDLLVAKSDGLFLVELKRVGGPVVGAVNGRWQVHSLEGPVPLPGGRGENPYQQMLTQYRVLSDWLERNKERFLTRYSTQVIRFRPLGHRRHSGPRAQVRSLLTFYPHLPAQSRLNIGAWPVEVVSFPDLAYLLRGSTKRVSLTEEEIVALAQALHLTRWETPVNGGRDGGKEHLTPTPWLRPRGLSLRDAWLHVHLSVVEFLLIWFIQRRERLVQELSTVAPPRRSLTEATGLARLALGLKTPPQPQPVVVISKPR